MSIFMQSNVGQDTCSKDLAGKQAQALPYLHDDERVQHNVKLGRGRHMYKYLGPDCFECTSSSILERRIITQTAQFLPNLNILVYSTSLCNMKTSFVTGAMVAAAAAAPSAPKQCPSVPRNANFDDLTPLPLVAATPVPTPYMGLLFQAVDFFTTSNPGFLPGIAPHSGKNFGGIGLQSQLRGTPMLTTNYPSSNIQSLQLESFYFACVVQAANSATAVPTACNIYVTGYTGNDNTVSASKQVCAQSYSYNPTTALAVQQMAFGKFDDCAKKDLQFATIQFNLPGGSTALGPLSALVIDDVKYSTKAKSC
jgi:hypothetical protein